MQGYEITPHSDFVYFPSFSIHRDNVLWDIFK